MNERMNGDIEMSNQYVNVAFRNFLLDISQNKFAFYFFGFGHKPKQVYLV